MLSNLDQPRITQVEVTLAGGLIYQVFGPHEVMQILNTELGDALSGLTEGFFKLEGWNGTPERTDISISVRLSDVVAHLIREF